MSFLDEMKARTKRGPGAVEVYYGDDEKPVVIPLKYPKAIDQAKVMEHLNGIDTTNTGAADSIRENEVLATMIVRACIDTDEEISEEELTILIRESGGYDAALVKRCNQLMGFGTDTGGSRIVKHGGKKRGR